MCLSRCSIEKPFFVFRVLFALLSLTVLSRAGDLTGVANLSWDVNPESNIAGYRVLYGTTSGSLTQSHAVFGNNPAATVTGLETGRTHYFAVLAYNSSGLEGPMSDEVAFHVDVPTVPEISIESSPSAIFTDGQSVAALGEVRPGGTGISTELVIRNTGTASLTGLLMEIDGTDHPDFSITSGLPLTPILTANAGFSADFSAWTPSGNLRIIRDATSAGAGNVVDFNFSNTTPNGSISQNFATVPGATYTLTFDIGILAFNFSPQTIQVSAAGSTNLFSQSTSITGTGNGSTRWESHRFTFVADSSTTKLTLTDVSTGTDGADLRLDNVRVTDANSSSNAPQALTLEPGQSSTISVAFRPSSVGAKTAYLHVFSNDADESPFDLTLSGTATGQPGDPGPFPQPEIEVKRAAGTELSDGSTAIAFDDTILGTSAEIETLVIRNTGTSPLTGLSSFVDGTHADDFPAESPDLETLAPGESTLVRIHFQPTATGARNATLQIFSNDADEASFEINLAGNGMPAPEIAAPEISIGRANGINLNDGSGIGFGGTLLNSSSATEVLTIRNIGTANLDRISIILDGIHASDFVLGGAPAASLAPGAETTFTATFKPTATGIRSAAIRIASSDADESTFDIALDGEGVAMPEIAVERASGYGLTHAISTVEFTGVVLGSIPDTEILTIRNTGTAALTGIGASISGPHAADFILAGPGTASLPPGATTTLTISFNPSVSGPRGASVRISSNDTDENPFEIALSGNGVATPNITVGAGSAFPGSPASADFGNVRIGGSGDARTFTIANSGTADLSGLELSLDGPQPDDFILSPVATSLLAPGTGTAFTVTFNPKGSGQRSATLNISSNDPDTNPYQIVLTGSGTAFPRIALFRANGNPVAIGADTVSFGSVDLGSASPAETLTIRNTGTAALTNLAAIAAGNFGADFLVSALDTTTLAPGASTSFRVSFRPLAAGTRSAVLQLASNDTDSGTLTVPLTGSGFAYPVMALESMEGARLEPGSTLPRFGSVMVGSSGPPLTLRIRNTGTAALPGLSVSSAGPAGNNFTVTQPVATSLEPGGETYFTVAFKPGSGGAKSAVLRISNSSTPEAPFEIVMAGDAITVPAIALIDQDGADLSASATAVNFGTLDLTAAPKARTYSIRSTGTAALTGVRILKEGPNAADFTVSATAPESIAPAAAFNFNISFKPSAAGNHSAAIRIISNTGLDIVLNLLGKGIATPEIKIEAVGKNLKSGESFVNLGSSQTSTRGETRTFTISNIGSVDLEKLALVKNGVDASDFIVSALKTTTLAPGKSTTFNVTFKPSASGIRWAAIHITSNDADERSFSIGLTGKGTNKPDTSKVRKKSDTATLRTDRGVEVIAGAKYRTLTIHKTSGTIVNPSEIEVSSDLTEWSSGPRHTTVIRDNDKVLTVRDNIPITPGSKRHIRLKP